MYASLASLCSHLLSPASAFLDHLIKEVRLPVSLCQMPRQLLPALVTASNNWPQGRCDTSILLDSPAAFGSNVDPVLLVLHLDVHRFAKPNTRVLQPIDSPHLLKALSHCRLIALCSHEEWLGCKAVWQRRSTEQRRDKDLSSPEGSNDRGPDSGCKMLRHVACLAQRAPARMTADTDLYQSSRQQEQVGEGLQGSFVQETHWLWCSRV